MRVEAVRLHHVRIPLRRAFGHSLKTRTRSEAVLVEIEGGNRSGWGEIQPRPYLTGETIEEVWHQAGPRAARRWLGQVFEDPQALFASLATEVRASGRQLATFAGFELALLDLAGQIFHVPAAQITGRPVARELPSGAVIDFCVATRDLRRHCRLMRLAGRTHLKVKVGRDDDLERLAIVSEAWDQPFRIDANGAWSPSQAVEALSRMRAYPIASVEQPVPAQDLEGMRRVRQECGIPVMADESLCSLEDGQQLIEAGAADIFNIRLAKCGGFSGSTALVELAEEVGIGCHLGSVVGETGILATAAEKFGARFDLFACLEGKGQHRTLLAKDLLEPSDPPTDDGLGIAVSRELVQKHSRQETCFRVGMSEETVDA